MRPPKGSALHLRRKVVAVLLAAMTCGCTLPSEQLQLPGPITGTVARPDIAQNNQRYGVPLSNPGAPSADVDRVNEGTGTFMASSAGDGAQPEGDLAGGPRVSDTGDGGIMLNFVDAKVAEFAQAVLGDVLKLNYTVSDQVKASVTLRTPNPVPKQELLAVFTSVLKAQGIEMTEQGGIYIIAPSDRIAQTGTPANWGGARGRAGSGTQAITLRYVAASEMERILKSVAPDTRILRTDGERNMLLVSGSPAELNSVNETVRVFDVDWMRGMSVAMFAIESGDAEAVAQEMDQIFANDRDSPTKGIIRFIPNKRLRSVLAISSRPEYIRKAQQWIRKIDLAGQATEKQVHVYHVQNRPAEELAELLRKVYVRDSRSGSGAAVDTSPDDDPSILRTVSTPPEIPSFGGAALGVTTGIAGVPAAVPGQPLLPATQTTPLDAAAGTQPSTGGDQMPALTPGDDRGSGIMVVADVPNNSLVITATHQEYERMRHILARIDIAPNQVMLEATIAEVTLNDQLQYGLKWFFKHNSSEFSFTDSALGAVAPTFGGFSYFLDMPNVQVALDALSKITNVNVVSSPSLTVLDNKKAVLQIGDEVPIATQSAVSVVAPGAPIVNSIGFRNTGVILGITPRIGDNGRVLLDIEQEVSDVVPTTSSTLDSPTIQQRRIKTTVAVGDGESIVLAGLMQDRSDVTKSQIPLLGDIPVLGNAFKMKDNQIRRTELLIALTPHILKDPAQIRAVAAEFRDRMNFTTRPQRVGPPDKREDIERLIVR